MSAMFAPLIVGCFAVIAQSPSPPNEDKLPTPPIPEPLKELITSHSIVSWIYWGFLACAVIVATLAAVIGNLQKAYEFLEFFQKKLIRTQPEVAQQELLENRGKLLRDLKRDISLRLGSSLHSLIKVDLQMENQRQQVGQRQTSLVAEDPSGPEHGNILNRMLQLFPKNPLPTQLPPTQKIIEVFERSDIQERLLILGEPGAGKTTELLTLAQALLQRTVTDSNHAIPIIFELSAWKEDKPIDQWLTEQLKAVYTIPKEIGQQWLNEQQLLPLLDGLDELGLERQRKCVEAIEQFLIETPLPGLVVCCRREEYEQGQTQLEHLNGAVYLQSLTENQIQQYLRELNRFSLWEHVRSEPELLHLAHSPLFLTMLVVAYQGRAIRTTQELFNEYIKKQLHDPNHQGTYPPRKEPSESDTLHYLVWLAKKLEATSETVFLIENMQPTWLESSKQRCWYRTLVAMLFGLIFGLFGGLFGGLIGRLSGGLIFGLFGGLIVGLIVGLIGGLFGKFSGSIEPIEKLAFDKEASIGGLISGLLFGLSMGLIFGLSGGLSGGLLFGLSMGLISGLIVGLIRGLSGVAVEAKNSPNQGMWKSLQNILIVGLIVGLISGLLFGLSIGLISGLNFGLNFGLSIGLNFGLVFGLSIGLIFGLISGLGAVIQHICLRLVLYYNGYVPWNYARFLDHAVKHRFIQRVGGRYRFMHDLLRKHFAEMKCETIVILARSAASSD